MCKKENDKLIIMNSFLFIKLWYQLIYYLSFKLFLKITKFVNKSNTLNFNLELICLVEKKLENKDSM